MKNSSLTWKQKYEIASRHFSAVFCCSALNIKNIFHSICLTSAFRFHGRFFFDEHLKIWCDPNKIPVKLLEFYSFACDVIEIFTYFIRCVGETNITKIWLTNKILWNEDKKKPNILRGIFDEQMNVRRGFYGMTKAEKKEYAKCTFLKMAFFFHWASISFLSHTHIIFVDEIGRHQTCDWMVRMNKCVQMRHWSVDLNGSVAFRWWKNWFEFQWQFKQNKNVIWIGNIGKLSC